MLLLLLFIPLRICAIEAEATISLSNLFNPDTDMENGIKGTVNAGGKIEVKIYEKGFNVLVYHAYITSSSTTFAGTAVNYNKSSLGDGATCSWRSPPFLTAFIMMFSLAMNGSSAITRLRTTLG